VAEQRLHGKIKLILGLKEGGMGFMEVRMLSSGTRIEVRNLGAHYRAAKV
jgi:hypothetical protein